jgi:hypothetical protein
LGRPPQGWIAIALAPDTALGEVSVVTDLATAKGDVNTVLWWAGWHGNTTYKTVLDWFETKSDNAASEYLSLDDEENVETYSILGGTGSKTLRKPTTGQRCSSRTTR